MIEVTSNSLSLCSSEMFESGSQPRPCARFSLVRCSPPVLMLLSYWSSLSQVSRLPCTIPTLFPQRCFQEERNNQCMLSVRLKCKDLCVELLEKKKWVSQSNHKFQQIFSLWKLHLTLIREYAWMVFVFCLFWDWHSFKYLGFEFLLKLNEGGLNKVLQPSSPQWQTDRAGIWSKRVRTERWELPNCQIEGTQWRVKPTLRIRVSCIEGKWHPCFHGWLLPPETKYSTACHWEATTDE